MGQRGIVTNTVMSSQLVNAATLAYSTAINSLNLVGAYGGLLLTLTATGTMVITQQTSLDGITFYDPVSATLTTAGVIYSQLFTTTTPKYIQFTPIVSPYTRFKVDAVVASQTMSLTYISQGERE